MLLIYIDQNLKFDYIIVVIYLKLYY